MPTDIDPAEWFAWRLDSPPQVQVARGAHGAWDVLLRIDGGYSFKENAEKSAELMRQEIRSLLAKSKQALAGSAPIDHDAIEAYALASLEAELYNRRMPPES